MHPYVVSKKHRMSRGVFENTFGRDDLARTGDLATPSGARYQLRYIPIYLVYTKNASDSSGAFSSCRFTLVHP